MQFFIYIIFSISIYIIAIIPFWFLYQFSNILAFLFYYVFQYRKKVTLTNLRRSFPEKSDKEIRRIAKRAYVNLTDILIESIKGFTISEKQIKKRFKINNPELLNQYYYQGKSIIGVAAHYGNWEWGAIAGSLQIKHKAIAFYKPLTNKYIDRFLKKIRAENGTLLKSIYKTSATFKKYNNQACIYILVADQSPSSVKKAYWVDFLNQDTACLHGPEKHAKDNNYPLLFLKIQRVKRGYYELTAEELIEKPTETNEGEITQIYMHKLEEIIKENPENWLWSHKRWKRKRDNQNK